MRATNLGYGKGNFVYGLAHPETGEIRYVGKTTGYLNSRFRGHLREARESTRRNHRLNWLSSLLKDEKEPTVVVLTEVLDPCLLVEQERNWIALFRYLGARLVNETDGGEGMWNPPESTREKLRNRPQVGWTPAAREASRKRLRELWATPEFREHMAQKAIERYGPPRKRLQGQELQEFRVRNAQQMGALNKGRPKTFEHRAKLADATRRYLQKHGHPNTGREVSEETRAKMRAAWQRRKGVVP